MPKKKTETPELIQMTEEPADSAVLKETDTLPEEPISSETEQSDSTEVDVDGFAETLAPTEDQDLDAPLSPDEELGGGDESVLVDTADELPPDESTIAGDVPPEDAPALENESSAAKKKPAAKPKASKKKKPPVPEEITEDPTDEPSPPPKTPKPKTPRKRATAPAVLTIESRDEVETQADREDIVWHEIHNAYRTRKILTGILGGIEQTENRKTLAIVYYKEFRVVIPMSEMMLNLADTSGQNYDEIMLRQNKILGNMLGAEIDFIVKGIDSKARGVVASRKDAMLKKRQQFYMGTDASGQYWIYEDRIVQARVIAVSDKVIRIEAFGVECSIMARDLSWDWIGDAHERYSVGDQILVRILNVRRDSLEDISIKADVRSVAGGSGRDNLKKCRVQGKYAGKVTDVHKGIVFIRLSIGVNAVAHSCYDNRMPGKKDDVSFAVTHLDEERGVAVGIITRIIKQNL